MTHDKVGYNPRWIYMADGDRDDDDGDDHDDDNDDDDKNNDIWW